jgi:hypothetical protein
MKRLQSRILILVLGLSAPALADEDSPTADQDAEAPPATPDGSSRDFDPPSIDYPAAQALGMGTSLYVNSTYETTNDLSTFSWVTGHGDNLRLALGGNLQLGELHLAAEIPLQYTRLHIDTLQDLPTAGQDRDKASLSLGDAVLGVAYLWDLPIEAFRLKVGASLRARLPTHTTQFTFTLASGYLFTFGFPYYLHLAPGLVALASSKYLTFRVDESLLGMVTLEKVVTFDNISLAIPNLYFWESHYAVIAEPMEWLGLSLGLVSFIQLNRVADSGYTTLHDVKALMLDVELAIDFESYRASVAGRLGLTHGAQDFGVITFSGTSGVMVRLSYVF